MMEKKQLSSVGIIIVHHLLDSRHMLPTLTCPTTKLAINPGTSPKDTRELVGHVTMPRHYTWMGFHYVQTIREPGYKKIVKVFEEKTGNEVGYATSTADFFVPME